jgi:hypothetical protein
MRARALTMVTRGASAVAAVTVPVWPHLAQRTGHEWANGSSMAATLRRSRYGVTARLGSFQNLVFECDALGFVLLEPARVFRNGS